MTGPEFKAARQRAGLTYRAAATELGIALSTVQRYETALVVPDAIAARIEQLAAGGASDRHAYALGQVYAICQWVAGRIPPGVEQLMASAPSVGLGRVMALVHRPETARRRAAVADELGELLSTFGAPGEGPDLPRFLPNAQQGAFWLGYHHRRAAGWPVPVTYVGGADDDDPDLAPDHP